VEGWRIGARMADLRSDLSVLPEKPADLASYGPSKGEFKEVVKPT
jgi:hypothetical protein